MDELEVIKSHIHVAPEHLENGQGIFSKIGVSPVDYGRNQAVEVLQSLGHVPCKSNGAVSAGTLQVLLTYRCRNLKLGLLPSKQVCGTLRNQDEFVRVELTIPSEHVQVSRRPAMRSRMCQEDTSGLRGCTRELPDKLSRSSWIWS